MVQAIHILCPWCVFRYLERNATRTLTLSSTRNLDLSTGTSILDHDTNVFFTLPAGASSALYQLDLSTITNAASGGAIAWEAVSSPNFQQGQGEGVVMAEASNHISRSRLFAVALCLLGQSRSWAWAKKTFSTCRVTRQDRRPCL